MGNGVIGQKYEILDTLFTNELQTVYVGKESAGGESEQIIINEFKDVDIIYGMKDSFSPDKSRYIKNLVESFYIDFNFYVIGKICPGTPLDAFLSENSLRLTDKMYITESLLTQLLEMDTLSPILRFALLDCSNISVINKKNICFSCNLKFDKGNINVTAMDVISRAGEVICAIFTNTTQADIQTDIDNIPPALIPIIQKCKSNQYATATELYNDFKSLLLHSIFIGNVSVESQIRKNIKKAKIRRRLSPIKKLAAVVLIVAVLGGVWTLADKLWLHKNIGLPAISNTTAQPTNTKPTAKFAASKDKIYEGEQVIFVNQSTDGDINDFIKTSKWEIYSNGTLLASSGNQNLAYKFDKTGKYTITLSVSDSKDENGSDFKLLLEVLPKPAVPATNNPNSNNSTLIK